LEENHKKELSLLRSELHSLRNELVEMKAHLHRTENSDNTEGKRPQLSFLISPARTLANCWIEREDLTLFGLTFPKAMLRMLNLLLIAVP
jgi:hypothetical protein